MTDAEIYAAIFSDTIDFYQCNMQKAFNRLHLIAKVLEGRSINLYENTGTPARCSQLYNPSGVNGLTEIVMNSKIFSDTSIENINAAIGFLQDANQQTKENSCALIY
jgi:hypothetical protein